MQSSQRILTTHAGSLPRPEELLRLLLAQEADNQVDGDELVEKVRQAVTDSVRNQIDAGVDVVSDGEMSKPSYATDVKDRLTGFGGEASMEQLDAGVFDLDQFPDFTQQYEATLAATIPSELRFTSCDGPVSYVGRKRWMPTSTT